MILQPTNAEVVFSNFKDLYLRDKCNIITNEVQHLLDNTTLK